MVLNAQSGKYPGTSTGWYGYGYDGAAFNSSGLTHVTQIGYPVCLDSGEIMERNDSKGFKSSSIENSRSAVVWPTPLAAPTPRRALPSPALIDHLLSTLANFEIGISQHAMDQLQSLRLTRTSAFGPIHDRFERKRPHCR